MALELCSDNSSRTMSPRISFSHDLSQSDIVPVEHILRSISSSSIDFNFCTNDSSDQLPPSMADELFSNGKILPTQIKKLPTTTTTQPPQFKPSHSLPPPSPPPPHSSHHDEPRLPIPETEEKQNSNSKSFWGFKRSSSVGNGYARTLCPLPILSRSNSTGSSASSKRSSSSSKESLNHHKQQQQSQQKPLFSQKPPLKKSTYGSYGNSNNNGIRVNPVLNVHSANMFGLGSIFSNGKDKNNKKR